MPREGAEGKESGTEERKQGKEVVKGGKNEEVDKNINKAKEGFLEPEGTCQKKTKTTFR